MRTISNSEAISIAHNLYTITGAVTRLPGDEDFNFKITTESNKVYLLKISAADQQEEILKF
ncbi:MAG: Ser/Thr protein kinase RdoA (MazF antagonist), partial [Patiriisocius sp.]